MKEKAQSSVGEPGMDRNVPASQSLAVDECGWTDGGGQRVEEKDEGSKARWSLDPGMNSNLVHEGKVGGSRDSGQIPQFHAHFSYCWISIQQRTLHGNDDRPG